MPGWGGPPAPDPVLRELVEILTVPVKTGSGERAAKLEVFLATLSDVDAKRVRAAVDKKSGHLWPALDHSVGPGTRDAVLTSLDKMARRATLAEIARDLDLGDRMIANNGLGGPLQDNRSLKQRSIDDPGLTSKLGNEARQVPV